MEPAFSAHSNPLLCSYQAGSRIPRKTMPKKQISTEVAVKIVKDKLKQDAAPMQNLATFITSTMEPECEEIMLDSMNKNCANTSEYPGTAEMERSCVNMLANLYHAPLGESDEAVGFSTIGSSEGAMLAGLAFKTKWQNSRKAGGELISNPNIVIGSNVQICWRKFARFFEVDVKEVKVREGYYVMDPYKAVEMVDDHTICVVSILGSTYNGEFEDVKLLNELLEQKNKEKGWNVQIHVDAASGGFIAPFCEPELEWDFRLPLVRSINVSGHKYGLVYPGVGWIIWRTKQDLPEDLIFHYSLFSAEQPTLTLNMSKGSSQVIAQYYQMIRLGHAGYRDVMQICRQNAKAITEGLRRIGGFNIISKDSTGIPMVVFNLKNKTSSNEYELCGKLSEFGWIIRAYPMPSGAEHVTVVRIVVRPDLSVLLIEKLLLDIAKVLCCSKHSDGGGHQAPPPAAS